MARTTPADRITISDSENNLANTNTNNNTTAQRYRSSASKTLWAHLLHKSVPSLSSSPLHPQNNPNTPPITPIDKSSTSIRILLHDTQANLEKFSDRLDGLLSGVGEAKREVIRVASGLEEEREKMLRETVELGV